MTLKDFNAEHDQAYTAILNWMAENPRRVNANELSLMGFRRWKKAQRVWVPFSASCIDRKARKLAEWGLIARGHDSSGHTWYEPIEGTNAPPKPRQTPTVVMRDGRPVAVYKP